jgi:DNA adenine methylase
VQINNIKELTYRLKRFEPTKEEYKRARNIMKQRWNRKKIIGDICDLAAIYYFNHNTSYGPNFLGSPSSAYLQKERYEKMVKKAENFNVKNIEVKYNSFEYIIEQHKSDFILSYNGLYCCQRNVQRI